MKLSARNQLKGVVEKIETGAVTSIVAIRVGEVLIQASITNQGVADLGLKVGDTAYAVIKASHVIVGIDD